MNKNVKEKPVLKKFLSQNIMLFVFLVFLVCSMLFVSRFMTFYNIKNFLKNAAILLVPAVGLTCVTLNGGIDFSITSTISLGSVLGAYVLVKLGGGIGAVILIVLCIAVLGLLIGAVNGFAVSKMKMPSFVATLAMELIASGVAVWFGSEYFEGAVSLGGFPESFKYIGGKGDYFWIPILISAAVFLFFDWLFSKTVYGRQIYAIGVNPKTAEIAGIPVRRNIFLLFLISGGLSGLAAVLYTAKNQAGVPTLGDAMFIDIVGSVVIGGTSPAGGFGGIKNTLYGVLFLTLISNVLRLMGVDWYYMDLIKGVLVILAAILNLILKNISISGRIKA